MKMFNVQNIWQPLSNRDTQKDFEVFKVFWLLAMTV